MAERKKKTSPRSTPIERVGPYTYEEFLDRLKSFHGYPAPGAVIGGIMVDMAMERIPKGILFDVICETFSCLPDSVQLLTPCTVGNGWLRVINMGRYALSLYDKYTGEGVRVYLDANKLKDWKEIQAWFLKLKGKREQNDAILKEQIRLAGRDIYTLHPIKIKPTLLGKHSKGKIGICSTCGEAYPVQDGAVCRGCQGETPYESAASDPSSIFSGPLLKTVSIEQAVGKTALHDMTEIIPGESKGPALKSGQEISAGDMCRLQQMGRRNIYILEDNAVNADWVHENEAATSFAEAMAGESTTFQGPPREGRIRITASRNGLLIVDKERLERFNNMPGVMCASQRSFTPVVKGEEVASTRAIPLYLPAADFRNAMAILAESPLFKVLPLRNAKVGILVTGTEIFEGMTEDKFIPIISSKIKTYQGRIVESRIVPDDRELICKNAKELCAKGIDLLITTAGLSVDPDDVTRQGLVDAGATDLLYGSPLLPGAMMLLGRIGAVQVMGVPACALYFKTTAFDVLLPRFLTGLSITRRELAALGHGGLCLQCKICRFPKCAFGR